MFRMWASLDLQTPLASVPDHARRAEEMGFDGVLAPDVMSDGFLVAQAAIGATTPRTDVDRLSPFLAAIGAFVRKQL